MKILISTFIIFLFAATSWATDLSKATLKQLVTERPDLIEDIKAGKDKGTSIISVVKDVKGRMSVWTEVRRDINDNLIDKRKDIYTYYLTNEINTIIMEWYDSDNEMTSKKVLKHYRDGTQPNLSVVAVGISKEL